MTDLVERCAPHLQRALCTYVEGDDTRATELTKEELRDVLRAIIPLVLEDAAKVAEAPITYSYVSFPDMTEPGSPYDRGQRDRAQQIAVAIRALGGSDGQ